MLGTHSIPHAGPFSPSVQGKPEAVHEQDEPPGPLREEQAEPCQTAALVLDEAAVTEPGSLVSI